MELFSDQLRAAIEAADVSRYRLSKLTGVSQGQLSGFVRGTRKLSLDTIDRLAEELGWQLTVQAKRKKK